MANEIVDGPATAPEPQWTQSAVERELYGADAPKPPGMYPLERSLRDTLQGRVAELSDIVGLSTEQRVARHREFVAMVRDADLSPAVGKTLYDLVTDQDIAAFRGTDLLDDATRQTWRAESRRLVRATFPQENAERLLERTDRWARQHPKLAARLSPGLGDHPKIVLALVEHVRRVNFR